MTTLVPLYPESNLWVDQGAIRTVDISEFESDDFITIALPDYPASTITETSSYVDFTSNENGNFSAGPTDSVAFSESIVALSAGDSEFRFEIGELNSIDLSQITGIRFRIDSTGTDDFRVLAIRAISKDWLYTPIDMDTITGRGVRPVTPDGAATSTYEAPFTTWPKVFKSSLVYGLQDPQPIDANLSLIFNPGSQLGSNVISLFFREKSIDYQTQDDLDGIEVGELDGLEQPDYAPATFVPRVQIDIDGIEDSVTGPGVDPGAETNLGLTQADLDGTAQGYLDNKPDLLSAVWIEVRLSWDSGGATVEVYDAEDTLYYSFAPTLVDQTEYVMFADLEDRALRLQIHEREVNVIGDSIFDSGWIVDAGLFKRRKGRIGWSASIEDGDAYIGSIDPRYLNFAEFRSESYRSITPVTGVTLNTDSTPDSNLVKGINPGPWGGTFVDNPDRGANSFTVRNSAVSPLQGIQTNFIYFDDLRHTKLSFQVYVTQESLNHGSLDVFLWDGYRSQSIPMPKLNGNLWNDIDIDLAPFYHRVSPNYYTVVIVQTLINVPNEWKIDNLSVARENVEWSGKGGPEDIWTSEEGWIPFRGLGNSVTNGINFENRATSFQVRGKALRQDSQIAQINSIPKYSDVGRQTFDERPEISHPTVGFSTVITDLSVEFTSDDNLNVAQHVWSFGDGEQGIGSVTNHTYALAGTYTVNLTVVLKNGELLSFEDTVTV